MHRALNPIYESVRGLWSAEVGAVLELDLYRLMSYTHHPLAYVNRVCWNVGGSGWYTIRTQPNGSLLITRLNSQPFTEKDDEHGVAGSRQ